MKAKASETLHVLVNLYSSFNKGKPLFHNNFTTSVTFGMHVVGILSLQSYCCLFYEFPVTYKVHELSKLCC